MQEVCFLCALPHYLVSSSSLSLAPRSSSFFESFSLAALEEHLDTPAILFRAAGDPALIWLIFGVKSQINVINVGLIMSPLLKAI